MPVNSVNDIDDKAKRSREESALLGFHSLLSGALVKRCYLRVASMGPGDFCCYVVQVPFELGPNKEKHFCRAAISPCPWEGTGIGNRQNPRGTGWSDYGAWRIYIIVRDLR